ncbi:MAG: hypothetical protein LUG96_09705 [Tannerellaceae bacterium]|nr:hypothetical protein [Tannerellaceae bacterium]
MHFYAYFKEILCILYGNYRIPDGLFYKQVGGKVNAWRETMATLYTLAFLSAYLFLNRCRPMDATLYTLRIVSLQAGKKTCAAEK